MMTVLASLIGASCIGIAIYLFNRSFNPLRDAGRLPLPPGPRGFPLVGNVNDFPSSDTLAAQHWLKHKALYGPISSVTIMGQPVILVNDARLAIELCDKRSSKYSSRPRQVFAGEMMGWANSLGLVPHNNLFKAQRKIVHQIIGTNSAASQFHALEEAEVGHFLLHLLENPENLVEHVKTEIGSVTLRIAYGYTAESHKNDPLIDMSTDVMTKFSRAAVPGTYLVDTFPFLRKLPDWLPGTSFKELARQWERELLDVTEKPFAFVKHQMAQGTNKSSFLSQLLEDKDSPEDDYTKKWAAGSLYTAGADTSVTEILSFFLVMVLYPEIQRLAQEEIDQVIADQIRLPTIADRGRMPYVAALTTEILRWHPAAPMGLPHTSTEDDIFEGYFIPKGSMLLMNIWHFTHDPDTYKDPMEFRPERFLGKNAEPDPLKYVFGFGRRACPGRILAQNTLFLTIAQTLAGFNITKKGESTPALNFGPGVVSRVAPFECVIKPRSPHHEKLIRSIESKYPWEESDSKVLESMHVSF
ncbi:cytochrome P450 [Xylaria curta]|nr:cytochrome P450 [Xylaria curta]